MEKILTLQEAAKVLKIPISSMYLYFRIGTLKGFKIGKHWRITEKSVNEFIQSGEQLEPQLKIRSQRKQNE